MDFFGRFEPCHANLWCQRSSLAASQAFVAEHGPFPSPDSLRGAIGVSPGGAGDEKAKWNLTASDGTPVDIEYRPVMITDDVYLLMQAAVAGAGIGQLPFNLCGDARKYCHRAATIICA